MAKDEEFAIKVENVSKTFRLPHEKHSSIKSALIHFRNTKKGYAKQQVLKGVSFEVKKGEFFGIVGRNGSGKSTLLKLLAGIYTPDAGNITINGSLTPFIELGVGFNHELTGRENVFLNGALLGFNRREMETMYDDIVTFAELEDFMDQKLKNYSSGMQVRLAFSIAIRAHTGIVILDEVLAVGDAAFQQKCFDVFSELKKNGVTIVLVTHDMNSVLRFCDRAMLVSNGEIAVEGKPGRVAEEYLALNYQGKEAEQEEGEGATDHLPKVNAISLANAAGNSVKAFEPGETCKVSLKYTNPTGEPIHFGFQIYSSEADIYCFGTNTRIGGLKPVKRAKGTIEITAELDLVPGNYYITVATLNDSATVLHHYRSKIAEFRIKKKTEQEGVVLMNHKWRVPRV